MENVLITTLLGSPYSYRLKFNKVVYTTVFGYEEGQEEFFVYIVDLERMNNFM